MLVKVMRKFKKKAAITLLFFLLGFLVIPLPDPLFDSSYATILHSSDGHLLSASIAKDQQWRFPPTDVLPEKFEVAIRLFEDEYFHYHPGINPISILRAMVQNFEAGKVISGGSTLSMQTIRMALGNKHRTYSQKLLEVLITLKMEALYSKEAILKSYANHAPFGGNIIGINAAAWRYYGRAPQQLSWAETAALAILPNDPAGIFPGKNEAMLRAKRNALLQKISDKGYLNENELFLSLQEPLPQKIRPLPNHAYHLLHRAKSTGHSQTIIPSTLDAKLQVTVSQLVNNYSRKMAKNEIHNAAALVMEIESGKTLAYVGNTNNPGNHGRHVDVITAKRSPGSLLKPFLYALALDDGLITPNQLLPDIPIFYKGFAPKNFDKEYRGAIPASEALTSSLNVPFVHLLIEYGYERFHQKLVNLGLKSFDKPAAHYGLSIILGGAESSLWELSNAYAGMARASQNFMKRPINKNYSNSDYLPGIFIDSEQPRQYETVLSSDGHIRAPSIDFTLQAMTEVKRPEEESGWEYFGSSEQVSWKTGTSFGFRDGWAIGLNGKFLVGIWLGNADGEGRPGLTGVRAAAPLMFEVFDLLDNETKTWERFGAEYAMCKESGMLATDKCPTEWLQLPEYMASGKSCNYHQWVHLDREGQYRVNSNCYPIDQMTKQARFVLPPAQSWYYKKYHPNYQKLPASLPDCQETEAKQSFELIYPRQFTKVHIPLEQDGKKGHVIFEAAHENKDQAIFWHLDYQFLGATHGIHQMGINTNKGAHLLTLVDESGVEMTQKFEVIN